MKFSINDIFNKCNQIRSFLWIWSHLLKKSLLEDFSFCAVTKPRRMLINFSQSALEDISRSPLKMEIILKFFKYLLFISILQDNLEQYKPKEMLLLICLRDLPVYQEQDSAVLKKLTCFIQFSGLRSNYLQMFHKISRKTPVLESFSLHEKCPYSEFF